MFVMKKADCVSVSRHFTNYKKNNSMQSQTLKHKTSTSKLIENYPMDRHNNMTRVNWLSVYPSPYHTDTSANIMDATIGIQHSLRMLFIKTSCTH